MGVSLASAEGAKHTLGRGEAAHVSPGGGRSVAGADARHDREQKQYGQVDRQHEMGIAQGCETPGASEPGDWPESFDLLHGVNVARPPAAPCINAVNALFRFVHR